MTLGETFRFRELCLNNRQNFFRPMLLEGVVPREPEVMRHLFSKSFEKLPTLVTDRTVLCGNKCSTPQRDVIRLSRKCFQTQNFVLISPCLRLVDLASFQEFLHSSNEWFFFIAEFFPSIKKGNLSDNNLHRSKKVYWPDCKKQNNCWDWQSHFNHQQWV